MKFDYIYGKQADQYSFVRIPKRLVTEKHFPIDEISKDMGVGRRKAMECLSELEKEGLVQKQTRGNGLPNLLYVKDFVIT